MKIFVNEAVAKAVHDYLISKDAKESVLYNSFLVVVIRMLITIYGELDIINPYQMQNVEALTNNLMKFGASKLEINNIYDLILSFYLNDLQGLTSQNNTYFIEIQKRIIDLFTLRRVNYGLEEGISRNFFDLLYTPGSSNIIRISYNYKNASDVYEIAEYYKESMQIKGKEEEEEEKDLLGFDVYKLFNYSVADISKMDKNAIEKLNKQIYAKLDINENAINKDYLLQEKIRKLTSQKQIITTGNGYVDILLIMSIIVTSLMVVVIFVAVLS